MKIDKDIMNAVQVLSDKHKNKEKDGMSQRELASRLQIAPSTIGRYLRQTTPQLTDELRAKFLTIDRIKDSVQDAKHLATSGVSTVEVPIIGNVLDGAIIPNTRPPYTTVIPVVDGIDYSRVYTIGLHARSPLKVFQNWTCVFVDTESSKEQLAGFVGLLIHLTLKEDYKDPEKRLSFVGKLTTFFDDDNKRLFNLISVSGRAVLKNHDFDDIENINDMFAMYQNDTF